MEYPYFFKKKKQNLDVEEQILLNDDQSFIYPFLARYNDMFITTSSSNDTKKSRKIQRDMHQLYVLHILNHVLTTRTRISRNNRLIKEMEEKADEKDDIEVNEDDDKLSRRSIKSSMSTQLYKK